MVALQDREVVQEYRAREKERGEGGSEGEKLRTD